MQALLVEDDEAVVEHIELCLTRLGYKVTIARDGMAALQCCREQVFDWVVCDVRMPRLNGISFNRNVRPMLLTAAPRIVVIAAMDDNVVKSEAMSAGAEAFLLKPVSMQMLNAVLGEG